MFSSTNYHSNVSAQLVELASRFADAEAPDRTVKSEYDKYGRLAKVVYDDLRTEEYTRDTWGKILKVTATDGETVRESVMKYDYFDRLIEQIETVNGKLAVSNKYAYNAYGQRTLRETQTPLGPQTETREYDQFGRLTRIKSGTDEVVYEYNNLNQVATRTANGIPVVYTYTAQGQLQSKTLGDGIATQEYFYAPSGQLTGRSVNGEKVDYQYDARGQLLAVVNAAGETVESYTYDPAGNILEKMVDGETTTFTYDAANQLVTSMKGDEVTNYAYDAAGRLVKSGTTEYSYGWMDKVLSITENESVTKEVSYYLNGQVAQVNDLSNQSVESFTWDGLALIQRNAISYLNEPAVTGGNPILADGKALFEDHLGSSAGVYSDGEYQAIERTAFGEVKESNDFNFYTGKPEIEGLGYAFLFRNYQAGTGKWQTTDPMGYPDGWNNLAYVNNGVMSAIDPLGLWTYSGHSGYNGGTSITNLGTFYNNAGNMRTTYKVYEVSTFAWELLGAAGSYPVEKGDRVTQTITYMNAWTNGTQSNHEFGIQAQLTSIPGLSGVAAAAGYKFSHTAYESTTTSVSVNFPMQTGPAPEKGTMYVQGLQGYYNVTTYLVSTTEALSLDGNWYNVGGEQNNLSQVKMPLQLIGMRYRFEE